MVPFPFLDQFNFWLKLYGKIAAYSTKTTCLRERCTVGLTLARQTSLLQTKSVSELRPIILYDTDLSTLKVLKTEDF